MLGFTIAPSSELVQQLYLSTTLRISDLRCMLGDFFLTWKIQLNGTSTCYCMPGMVSIVSLLQCISLTSVTDYVI